MTTVRGRRLAGRHGVGAVRAALLIATIALTPGEAVHAQSAVSPQTYKLAPGDRIQLMVFGQPELSGELVIDIGGDVVLPFVGTVAVADLTVAESQKRIVERLADGVLTQPSVSVRIAELRPIFIIGDIRTAGAQPFRFGMTVKTAVAAAGGYGSAQQPVQGTAVSDLLASDERVRQLTLQRQVLMVRRARLESQRDGASSFTAPVFPAAPENTALSEMVKFETETFQSQNAIQQSQVELLQAQRPRIQNEIDALTSQIATRRKQLELVKTHADQYSKLVKQGLGLSNLEMQLKLTEATYESEIWNQTGQVARLRMDLGALDLRIQETDAAFKRQVLTELRDVREKLQDLDVTLPTAREIRAVKLQQSTTLSDPDAVRSIKITRTTNGQAAEFEPQDNTTLAPGDILEVQIRLPRAGTMPDASAARSGPPEQPPATVAVAPLPR